MQPVTSAQRNRPSRLAEVVTAMRASVSLLPAAQRPFEDRYARLFLTDPKWRLLTANRLLAKAALTIADRRFPGLITENVLRYAYADAAAVNAVRDGIEQVVNVGAGYDVAPLRLPLDGVRVFELDQVSTQDRKRSHLSSILGLAEYPATLSTCDLRYERIEERLPSSGFDPSRPALFLVIGLLVFFPPDVAGRIVSGIAEAAAPGSRLLFDHMYAGAVAGTLPDIGARRGRLFAERVGEPWTFGLDAADVEPWLAHRGFAVQESLDITALRDRFGRPDAVPSRSADFMGIVTAVKR